MSIAFFDADNYSSNVFIPNIEIMKLSSYYKSKGEIVLSTLTPDPDMYSKLIIYANKPYVYSGKIRDNIEFLGKNFTDTEYNLTEEEYLMIPDEEVYSRYKNKFSKIYDIFQNGCHLRGSLDGKNIYENYQQVLLNSFKYTTYNFFYDNDPMSINGYTTIFEESLRTGCYNYAAKMHTDKDKIRRATFFNPIPVRDFGLMINWIKHNYLSDHTEFISEKMFTIEESMLLLSLISNDYYKNYVKIFVNITPIEKDIDIILSDNIIVYLLNYAISKTSKSYISAIKNSLKIEECPHKKEILLFFNDWTNRINLKENYITSLKKDDSINDNIKKYILDILEILKNKNPKMFNLINKEDYCDR